MKSGNRDKVEGAVKDVKGRAKEGVGRATNKPDLELEGQKDQVRGKGQKAVGEAKKALNK